MLYTVCYTLICVQPDTFLMGSEEGSYGHDEDEVLHEVTLTHWLAAGRSEFTQDAWEGITGDNPSDCDYGCGEGYPVQRVNWLTVVEFLNELSDLEGLERAYLVVGSEAIIDLEAPGWRLPTEAEWEYIARAGEDTLYSGSNDVDEVGYCEPPPIFDDFARPGGLRAPNAWGFVDMSGNLREWVHDWYDDEFYVDGDEDPTGPIDATYKGSRSGAWFDHPTSCRVANRSWDVAESSWYARGFRPVRTLPVP